MLTNFSMVLKFNLWHTLISWFASGVANYGWAIILFTIALKLVMSPLDIYQRISSKKQQKFMSEMQPELQAIQTKYANDKNKLNQETAKIYKKHNFSVGGMCLSMLLTMGLSMVVFFTLYSSLRSFGEKKLYDSYKQLDKVCISTLNGRDIADLNEEELKTLNVAIETEYKNLEKQNSWLWVKNVWKSDTNTSQFIEFEQFATKDGLNDAEKTAAKIRYDHIVKLIDGEKTSANGYYILIILSVVISCLTQWLSMKLTMPKGQKMNAMNKVMLGIIPITMLILAFTSNVVFTLYIIMNSVMTAAISAVLAFTINRTKKDDGNSGDIIVQKKSANVMEYSRNYKKP